MRSVSLNFANALKNATRDGIVPRWLISIAGKTFADSPADAVEVMRSFSTYDDHINIDVVSTKTGLVTTRQFLGSVNLEIGRIPRVSELRIQQVEVKMSATAPAVNDFIRSNNLKGARVEIWVQLLSPQSRVPVGMPELAWLGIIDGAPIDEGDDGVMVSLTVVNEAMVMLTRSNPAKSSHEEGKKRLLPDGRPDDFSIYAGSVKQWREPWGED